MRTKTLLIAAAALAAGLVSSQAQVYSQNVVGYANVPAPVGNANYLLTVPFQIGLSNGANEIWPVPNTSNGLPDGSFISIWNGLSYDTYESDSGSSSLWDDAGGNPISYSPTLPVGAGFFLSPASGVTNLFSGTVAVQVGTSNQMVLATGSANYLVGCMVPYSGAVTNGNVVTGAGGPCLFSPDGGVSGLPDGSFLSIWNGLSYDTYRV